MQFPSVQGENLTGEKLAFPRDFGNRRTLAIVAFDLKARGALESWVPFIDGFVRAGTVNGRVFPVLSRSMQIAKGMIVTAMRKAVPTEARPATVPLFVDLDEFCAALDIADRSAIYVCVIDPDGTVRERQAGPYSVAAAAALEAQLTAPAR